MTNDEIVEAKTLVASMRDDLGRIAGTTDADNLAALIVEKWQSLRDRFYQLVRHRPAIFGTDEEYDSVSHGLAILLAVAELRCRHDPKGANLAGRVKEYVPRVDATLATIAQTLSELQGMKR